MSMNTIELDILRTLAENGYELSVADVWKRLPGKPSIGRVYVSGRRLQDQNLIEILEVPGGAERQGMPVKMFRLTGDGLAIGRGKQPT